MPVVFQKSITRLFSNPLIIKHRHYIPRVEDEACNILIYIRVLLKWKGFVKTEVNWKPRMDLLKRFWFFETFHKGLCYKTVIGVTRGSIFKYLRVRSVRVMCDPDEVSSLPKLYITLTKFLSENYLNLPLTMSELRQNILFIFLQGKFSSNVKYVFCYMLQAGID